MPGRKLTWDHWHDWDFFVNGQHEKILILLFECNFLAHVYCFTFLVNLS